MKYEKWSLGYWCLKKYICFADQIINNKIILKGKENIPTDKPILFAPNHQNALSDPMAILLHTKFQPVWLARADIFKPGIITLILRFLKIMPVYRLRDGKEQLAKNEKTFADSIKVLRNNKPLALFPEAAHSGKRQMLSHKKAVPRIVFMAEEKASDNLDIHIIPTGIYYSSYWKFNRNVIVNFGKPIKVNDYLDMYHHNSKAATLSLRDEIYKSILPLTVHIGSKKHYNEIELIRSVYGKKFLLQQNKKNSLVTRFESDQKLVQQLGQMEIEEPQTFQQLCRDVMLYHDKVDSQKLRSWLVEKPEKNFGMLSINKLVLLLSLPVFLFGFILNAFPFFAIDRIVRKKVKDVAFWSSFSLVLGIIVFPVVYLLELWAMSSLLPVFWIKLVVLLSMPIMGKLAFRWYILLLKTTGRGRLFLLKIFKKADWLDLKEQQTSLFAKLDQLILKQKL